MFILIRRLHIELSTWNTTQHNWNIPKLTDLIFFFQIGTWEYFNFFKNALEKIIFHLQGHSLKKTDSGIQRWKVTRIKTTELINSEDHQMKEANKICKETAQLCHLNLCYFSISHGQNATVIHNTELILIFCSLYTYIPQLGEPGFISILSKCFHHKNSIQKIDWLELNTEFMEKIKRTLHKDPQMSDKNQDAPSREEIM